MATAICKRKLPRRHRVQVNLTLDPHILEDARKLMAEIGEVSLSNFVEGLIECVLRDSCEGCSAYDDLPDEEKARISGKVGAGKWITEDEGEG